jgi:hypothetical protein
MYVYYNDTAVKAVEEQNQTTESSDTKKKSRNIQKAVYAIT